jgi:hypothetical protein
MNPYRNCITKLGALALVMAMAAGARAGTIYHFQQGVSNGLVADLTYTVEDTSLRADTPTVNEGSVIVLRSTRPTSGNRHPLLRFDVSAAAAEAAVKGVGAADLILRNADLGPANTNHISFTLYALPLANTNWTELSATWNNQDQGGGIPWRYASGSAAPDAVAAAMDGTVIGSYDGSFPAAGQTITFRLDNAVVAQWLSDPTLNVGFVVHQDMVFNGSVFLGGNGNFYSSEFSTASFHPLLVLDIPEPGAALLALMGGLWLVRRRSVWNGSR